MCACGTSRPKTVCPIRSQWIVFSIAAATRLEKRCKPKNKDSSKSNFNTLVVTDSTQCIDVYQKKQEFFGSTLSVKKLSCNTSNINVDIHSSLYLNEL